MNEKHSNKKTHCFRTDDLKDTCLNCGLEVPSYMIDEVIKHTDCSEIRARNIKIFLEAQQALHVIYRDLMEKCQQGL